MKAIIAVNRLGWIGKNEKLPWKSSTDLLHFKKLTMGGKLLVGYKTAKSLPTLSGREIIVYNKNKPIEEYLNLDWCIGGKFVYETFCSYFTELHISIIDDETIGDVFFPDFTNLNTDCIVYKYYFK